MRFVDGLAAFTDSAEEGSVTVLVGVRAEEFADLVLAFGGEGDRIEFMVTRDRHRGAGIDHPSHEVYHLKLLWPPVDEISHEVHLPVRVPPCTTGMPVAELFWEGLEGVRVAMDVANNVKHVVRPNRNAAPAIGVGELQSCAIPPVSPPRA